MPLEKIELVNSEEEEDEDLSIEQINSGEDFATERINSEDELSIEKINSESQSPPCRLTFREMDKSLN